MTPDDAKVRAGAFRRGPGSALMLLILLVAPAGFGAALHVEITSRFSGEPLQPGSLRYQTSAGESFSITRVSYLLSGFALQRNDGQWLELSNRCHFRNGRFHWCRVRDLNPRRTVYKTAALPLS